MDILFVDIHALKYIELKLLLGSFINLNQCSYKPFKGVNFIPEEANTLYSELGIGINPLSVR
jgi:hypothetical protein